MIRDSREPESEFRLEEMRFYGALLAIRSPRTPFWPVTAFCPLIQGVSLLPVADLLQLFRMLQNFLASL